MAKTEIIEIEIDDELQKQVEDILKPMGLTIEELINLMLNWIVEYPSQALQLLKTELEKEKAT